MRTYRIEKGILKIGQGDQVKLTAAQLTSRKNVRVDTSYPDGSALCTIGVGGTQFRQGEIVSLPAIPLLYSAVGLGVPGLMVDITEASAG